MRRRLLKIYQRLRQGNPPQLEKATDLFKEKFFDVNRYRLGRVGRFRINRKFHQGHSRYGDDSPPRGLRQRDPLPTPSCGRGTARPRWTTSTTSAIAACGRSTNSAPTKSARTSSSTPHRPGTDEASRTSRKCRPTRSSIQERFRGDRIFLRPQRIVAGRRPDEPAQHADARAASCRPSAPAASTGSERALKSATYIFRTTAASVRSKRPKARTSG